uniref:Uncharacterized protein n=1 Tax=Cannabis sativa TaxID=3483 RepID=A0A803NNU3_CANSA
MSGRLRVTHRSPRSPWYNITFIPARSVGKDTADVYDTLPEGHPEPLKKHSTLSKIVVTVAKHTIETNPPPRPARPAAQVVVGKGKVIVEESDKGDSSDEDALSLLVREGAPPKVQVNIAPSIKTACFNTEETTEALTPGMEEVVGINISNFPSLDKKSSKACPPTSQSKNSKSSKGLVGVNVSNGLYRWSFWSRVLKEITRSNLKLAYVYSRTKSTALKNSTTTKNLKEVLEEAKGDVEKKGIQESNRVWELTKEREGLPTLLQSQETNVKDFTEALKKKEEFSLKEKTALEEALAAERETLVVEQESYTKDVEYHETTVAEVFYKFLKANPEAFFGYLKRIHEDMIRYCEMMKDEDVAKEIFHTKEKTKPTNPTSTVQNPGTSGAQDPGTPLK